AAALYGVEPLISDDYLEVEAKIAEAHPELVLGTQMERHTAKRLGIPCAMISSPAHVQDFPARTSPQMGFEGANVLFDTWVHPLMMGLEEHLLQLFREDFEFHDKPSHLGASGAAAAEAGISAPIGAESKIAATPAAASASPATPGDLPAPSAPSSPANPASAAPAAAEPETPAKPAPLADTDPVTWTPEGEQELKKIPFFVRGKARRNTERFCRERGKSLITVEDLYDAKAHFGR
ncbi:nitrogenase component 1, partial [Rhodocyclus purpureus]|uniref:nitrogenase component 1 n=1 Tax=Rhodocyclus purpureus TaxID=1067 RepID=UPI00237B2AAC